MKNKIITIVAIIILGVGAFFIGKSYYYNNIYNYPKIINESLEKYYVSGETNDLEPIGLVLDKYKDNEVKLRDVQSNIYDILKGWVDYLNNKYICDSNNVNSCRLYYNEIVNMQATVRKIYVYRAQILSQEKYTSLIDDLELKNEEVKEIIDDPTSIRTKNYEELRLEKCSKIIECSECRESLCDCTYINGENKKATVKCKPPVKEENK